MAIAAGKTEGKAERAVYQITVSYVEAPEMLLWYQYLHERFVRCLVYARQCIIRFSHAAR